MTQGTHHATDDPRNHDILVYVNGELRPRGQALVSVFDSGFILGDGVWEGLRVHRGRIAFLDAHLERLYEAAKAIDLDIGLDRAALTAALYRTLAANHMTEGVHLRLMVTRGMKSTPYQDPRACIGAATVVIIAEYKVPRAGAADARACGCLRCTCAAELPTCRTRSSTRTPSSTHHRLHPGHQGRCG